MSSINSIPVYIPNNSTTDAANDPIPQVQNVVRPVQLASVGDSVPPAATNAAATAGVPVLPAATGPAATPQAAGSAVAGVSSMYSSNPTGVMAFAMIWEALTKAQTNAQKTRTAMQQAANNAAVSGAEAQIKQITADQHASLVSLGGAVLGAVVPVGAMVKDKSGIAMQSATQFGQLATSAVEAGSQNFGPKATSYEEQINQKADDLQKMEFTQMTDSSDQTAKATTTGIDQAISALDAHFRRVAETSASINR